MTWAWSEVPTAHGGVHEIVLFLLANLGLDVWHEVTAIAVLSWILRVNENPLELLAA